MTDPALELPASLTGTVTAYAGNGRKLGYPTANIAGRTTLPDGVYFGYATLGIHRHHPALIFIGIPETMGDTTRRVEAHLLDIPDEDYYGQKIELTVRQFHRENQNFDSRDALLQAMHDDEAAGRRWFAAAQQGLEY